jgi:hypothetical protein
MNHFKIKARTLVVAALIIFISCNKEDIRNLFDLAVSNQLVINVANIQVVDAANPGVPFPVDSIVVEKMGEGQARIYDLEGWKDLKYGNSFIHIGVPPRDTPTQANPLKFSILIKHKNADYLPQTVTINLSSNRIEDRMVRLVNLSQPGIKSDAQTQLSTCASPAEIVLSTTFSTGRNTTITIPAGTKFKDKAGTDLCGEIRGLLLSFDPNDTAKINALSLFPGGLAYKAKDPAWQTVNRGVFTVYDFFSLYITVGGKDVYAFSNPSAPIKVSMNKNTEVNRPFDSNPLQKLKENDLIPIWSPNDSTVWIPETLASVSNGKVTFNINHTGWWSVSDPSCKGLYDWLERKFKALPNTVFTNKADCPPCNAIITVSTQKEVNSSYYTEISLANNPKMIVASPMMEYRNGVELSLNDYLGDIDKNTRIHFKVYDKEPWNGGRLLTSRSDFSPCDYRMDLTTVHFPQYANIATQFRLICSDSDGKETVLSPTASIYAKEVYEPTGEAATWSYIGIIRKGEGITLNKLQGGQKYKFAIFPNSSYAFTTDKITIEQTGVSGRKDGIEIPKDMTAPIILRFKNPAWNLDASVVVQNVAPKSYNLTMDWKPSISVCDGYKRRL